MADAIISVVAEQLTSIIKEQIQNEIHLVRGVDRELRSLSDKLKAIRNVLDDAENRRFKDKNIDYWLSRLEQTSYEMEDVLDEWNYAILKFKMENQSIDAAAAPPKQKVCCFIPSSCLCFKKIAIRHDIAKKIQNVKAQLDEILKEKDSYNFVTSQPTNHSPKWRKLQSTSLINLAEVQGRDFDRDTLVSKIMPNGDSQELGLRILSIVGVGGLGKTTLAQVVYNDSRIEKYFELRIWICVSDPFDEAGIAKEIVQSVRKESCPDTNQLEMLLQCVRDSILGKKFLLVLDDVWTEDHEKWKPLKNSLTCGSTGSTILLTTRNKKVAKIMGTMDNDIHRLGQLPNKDCWLLLRGIASFGRNEEEFKKFEDIGEKIANKCNGLPLAAKTLGSVLCFKNTLEEWENVLNSEIWGMKEMQLDLFPHLLLSYNELSSVLKKCFSYCAFFRKDHDIDVKSDLIENWIAQGYLGFNIRSDGDMELRGRDYFNNLGMHSLFQDFKNSYWDGQIEKCKMHDIVHDFAQYLRKNRSEGRAEATVKKTTCEVCDASLISNVREYRTLFFEKECLSDFCECLTSIRVLAIRGCDFIPGGMENLIHLRRLEIYGNKLSKEDTKTICKLYNLQFLLLVNCQLQEIPIEIGNLKNLRHLDLSSNGGLLELPDNICGLRELRTLSVDYCTSLRRLPEEIHRLINLKHLHDMETSSLEQFPQCLAQFTGLRTLTHFSGGSGWGKLGWLKNLNHLTGYLRLTIRLTADFDQDVLEDAREAELKEKIYIRTLLIAFVDEMEEMESSSSVRIDVLDALEPHQNLRDLVIWHYKGSKVPGWITSPLRQLSCIRFYNVNGMPSLPSLGKLPCLEEIYIAEMNGLEFVGREFLGLTRIIGRESSSTSSLVAAAATNAIAFPKLKTLMFRDCPKWKEWEDITAKEDESPTVSLMPCLTYLDVRGCTSLTALPHRLLRKASSLLEVLDICNSTQLIQRYEDINDGSAWKSIPQNNPRIQLRKT